MPCRAACTHATPHVCHIRSMAACPLFTLKRPQATLSLHLTQIVAVGELRLGLTCCSCTHTHASSLTHATNHVCTRNNTHPQIVAVDELGLGIKKYAGGGLSAGGGGMHVMRTGSTMRMSGGGGYAAASLFGGAPMSPVPMIRTMVPGELLVFVPGFHFVAAG